MLIAVVVITMNLSSTSSTASSTRGSRSNERNRDIGEAHADSQSPDVGRHARGAAARARGARCRAAASRCPQPVAQPARPGRRRHRRASRSSSRCSGRMSGGSTRTRREYAALAGPTWAHPFGTDELGRDTLARIIHGAQVSLEVGADRGRDRLRLRHGRSASSAATRRGVIDATLMRVRRHPLRVPGARARDRRRRAARPDAHERDDRDRRSRSRRSSRASSAAPCSRRPACRSSRPRAALGAGHARMVRRHVLPNIIAPMIVLATIYLGTAILTEAALSFLGLGTQLPEASWGNMLNEARGYVYQSVWMSIFPGAAIMIVVLGFNFLGDGLRDILDPRLVPRPARGLPSGRARAADQMNRPQPRPAPSLPEVDWVAGLRILVTGAAGALGRGARRRGGQTGRRGRRDRPRAVSRRGRAPGRRSSHRSGPRRIPSECRVAGRAGRRRLSAASTCSSTTRRSSSAATSPTSRSPTSNRHGR